MEFLIKSIESKSEYYHNKYYQGMIGRECDVIHLVPGCVGRLVVDAAYDPGNPHRFCTTRVIDVDNLDDGTIVFETENSVYTLVPNRKEETENENL